MSDTNPRYICKIPSNRIEVVPDGHGRWRFAPDTRWMPMQVICDGELHQNGFICGLSGFHEDEQMALLDPDYLEWGKEIDWYVGQRPGYVRMGRAEMGNLKEGLALCLAAALLVGIVAGVHIAFSWSFLSLPSIVCNILLGAVGVVGGMKIANAFRLLRIAVDGPSCLPGTFREYKLRKALKAVIKDACEAVGKYTRREGILLPEECSSFDPVSGARVVLVPPTKDNR